MTHEPQAPAACAVTAPAHPAPPDPPELPEGVERAPRWPWWYAIAGFLTALAVATVLSGVLFATLLLVSDGGAEPSDSLLGVTSSVVQNVAFAGTAIGFAYLTLRPRPWHFGFRRTRFWPAVGWTALGFVTFFLLQVLYGVLVEPEEQTTLEVLGADEGTVALVAVGVVVIFGAPVFEELFFRGFVYRSLRSKLPVWAAAVVDGLLFGALHVPTGPSAVPPLIVFGVILCLLYERTGSLYPPIALHAMNNTLAYMVGTEAIVLSAALGAAMLAACMLLPRYAWRAAPAAR